MKLLALCARVEFSLILHSRLYMHLLVCAKVRRTRCKDVFVSNVRVDAYVTLFLCSCSDPTSMLGLVRGMCALVGVIE
jgi:hypothetical protein